jgi:hypothetical protein
MSTKPFAQIGPAVSLDTGAYVLERAQIEQNPPNAFDPNNPAWSSGISTLVDLWLAKFGDKWVEGSELEGDIFFSIIATRLLKINRLERHNVPNKFHEVYRIVE